MPASSATSSAIPTRAPAGVAFLASTTGTFCLLSCCSRTANRFRAADWRFLPAAPGRQQVRARSSQQRGADCHAQGLWPLQLAKLTFVCPAVARPSDRLVAVSVSQARGSDGRHRCRTDIGMGAPKDRDES